MIFAPRVPRFSVSKESFLKLGLLRSRAQFGIGVDCLVGQRAPVGFRRTRVQFDGPALDAQRVTDSELVRKSFVELCHGRILPSADEVPTREIWLTNLSNAAFFCR